MSYERPSPIHPRNQPSQEAAKQETQKVEKVSDVDEDAKKKRKFRMAMGDEDLLNELNENAKVPGPLESRFYTPQQSDSDDLEDQTEDAIVADPSYTMPPAVS